MIAVPPGLTLPAYLDQTKVWIDGRSTTIFEIAGMDEQRCGYAARELARSATGIISLMETWALMTDGLVSALALITENPREWVFRQPLYQALASRSRPATGMVTTATDSVDAQPTALPRPGPHLVRRRTA